jgi:Zn-dependent protease with chaperone function
MIPRRAAVLLVLLAAGAALIAVLADQGRPPPLGSSLAPSARLLGTPLQLADRLGGRLVPVGALEERELGQLLHARYAARIRPDDPDQTYLDALMAELAPHRHRPLVYRAYAIGPCGGIKAVALPGGAVLVCRELLEQSGSEAEVVAVLAHEIGHLELGHCFERVRLELLTRRSGLVPLGKLADQLLASLVRRGYSQAAEHDSDAYAFDLLVASRYDPAGLADAFRRRGHQRVPQRGGLLSDLVRSHPPSELRHDTYRQKAWAWWQGQAGRRRYRGRRNLLERRSLGQAAYPGEWITASRAQATW